MTNTEQIVLRYPNDTTVTIVGDSFVIQQLLKKLDGIEITFTSKSGFFNTGDEK